MHVSKNTQKEHHKFTHVFPEHWEAVGWDCNGSDIYIQHTARSYTFLLSIEKQLGYDDNTTQSKHHTLARSSPGRIAVWAPPIRTAHHPGLSTVCPLPLRLIPFPLSLSSQPSLLLTFFEPFLSAWLESALPVLLVTLSCSCPVRTPCKCPRPLLLPSGWLSALLSLKCLGLYFRPLWISIGGCGPSIWGALNPIHVNKSLTAHVCGRSMWGALNLKHVNSYSREQESNSTCVWLIDLGCPDFNTRGQESNTTCVWMINWSILCQRT